MKRVSLLLLIFLCATASAQVFRRIGPDGQVYFSDRPGPDAEQVEVTPTQTISLPPVPERRGTASRPVGGATKQQGDSASSYTRFSIVSPINYEGYRANDGNVTVRLALEPELMPGHSIALNVDGEDGEKIRTGDGMAIELRNLSRGRHTVKATVVDRNGNAFIKARPVSFYVLRFAGG